MKYTLLTLLLASAILAQGQGNIWGGSFAQPDIKCGIWEKLPEVIGDWVTVDTLGAKAIPDTARHWVYDEEKIVLPHRMFDSVYRPCGSGDAATYEQYRICSITGIRQKRTRYFPYKYIPAPVSEYDHIVDSLTPKSVDRILIDTFTSTIYSVLSHPGDTLLSWHYLIDTGNIIYRPIKKSKKKKGGQAHTHQ